MKFAVWIVTPRDDRHWQGLADVSGGIGYSLDKLGYATFGDASEKRQFSDRPDFQTIIFNAHRLVGDDTSRDIIYNAEQVQDAWTTHPLWLAYLERLRGAKAVWDYSEENVRRLRQLGVERAVFCPVGYWPGLDRDMGGVEPHIDVVFYGSMNERRRKVIDEMQGRCRLNVRSLFGVYGSELDHWLARSKVVLNVHFYPHPIWEIFRCSRALASGKCVVSEGGGEDPALELLAERVCSVAHYGELADRCASLARDPARCQEVAWRGRQHFLALDQVAFVKAALEETL